MTEPARTITATIDVLTVEERGLRAALEARINVNRQRLADSAMEIGYDLEIIRTQRLYRDTHANWDHYLRDVWNITRERARQLIDAAPIIELFGRHGLQIGERQARPITHALPEDQEVIVQVARAFTADEGRTPSSSDIQAIASAVRDLANGAVVDHPDTGQPVPAESLPPEQRIPALVRTIKNRSGDLKQFQGTDDVKPLDFVDGLREMGSEGRLSWHRAGYWMEAADNLTGEVMVGPTESSVWRAIRSWRAKFEGSQDQDVSTGAATPEEGRTA